MSHNIALFVAILLLAIAAVEDARVRVIPNTCVVLVAVCGLILNALNGFESAAFSLAAGVAVLFACVLLFQFRLMGGGDAKLIPAACLLFPSNEILVIALGLASSSLLEASAPMDPLIAITRTLANVLSGSIG